MGPCWRCSSVREEALAEARAVRRGGGHAVGGVCPFGVNEGVRIYLDVSLRRFSTVFPAAGEENNAIELTPAELEQYTDNLGWIDVCKGWQPAEA